MSLMNTHERLGIVALGLILGGISGCGDVNIRDGMTAGYSTCQDIQRQFYFQVRVPPWKYNKEYRCSQWSGTSCVGVWNPTGRYVFVVSDVPFVNYDSEIIASMDVEYTSGSTATLVSALIASEGVGLPGSEATFVGESSDYPREVAADPNEPLSLAGHELLWRQNRVFQGATFNWYRRDVYLRGASGRVYHLKFFSIESLDKPEFDEIISSFREGAAPDDAPDCQCRDEHDPTNPSQDC